ncbi:MAG: sugar MFS transporter [Flavobacteriales bacterium]|jgi:glucose/galactose transporter|nr:sugar MFS transporter [Flavobacteriales bacterium]
MHERPLRPRASLAILGGFFFLFGFVTWLNGTLIPYLQLACELTTFQALFVAFAFYIAYFVTALPGAWVLRRTGFKRGMSLGLLVMALGALAFIPAAWSRTYALFLVGLFIIGTGLSLLQTAVNPYVTIIGPLESAARRISIMGICNKVAGVLAPLVLGWIVLADADTVTATLQALNEVERDAHLDAIALRVVVPYAIMAAALTVLAVAVRWSPLPEVRPEAPDTDAGAGGRAHVLHYPYLVLGVLALFVYVGAEVIAGDTIGTYARSQGIPLSRAKHMTSWTLAAMVVGYVLGIVAIPRYLSQRTALAGSAVAGVLFTALAMATGGWASVLCIALLGLANALVWPAIWPLAIRDLGRHTSTGSALLIMAIAGGALLPLAYGHLADLPAVGPKAAYALLLPCYAFIGYYALRGARLERWR